MPSSSIFLTSEASEYLGGCTVYFCMAVIVSLSMTSPTAMGGSILSSSPEGASSSDDSIYNLRKPSNSTVEPVTSKCSLILSPTTVISVFSRRASAICEATVRFQIRL